MTTSYIVKRCNSITFAKSFEYLDIKFDKDELINDKVIFISDNSNDLFDEPITVDEFINNKYEKTFEPLVIVELANHQKRNIKIPIDEKEYDDELLASDLSLCDKIVNELHLDDDALDEFHDALISFLDDNEFLSDKQLSKDFLNYLSFIYLYLHDGQNKLSILKLLNENNVNTSKIESISPVKYIDQEIDDVIPTSSFDDIKIVINKDDINAHAGSSVYKHTPDELKKAAVGNSTQLEAFSKNKFTVIHNKKSANIDNHIYKRNHDVLDSLARNGVVCSPNTDEELSIHKLMKGLQRFNHFDIVFIHPSYELKITRAESPCELIEPSYIINEGELLAVVYRYISIWFFGYCSVFNEEMEEFSYLI